MLPPDVHWEFDPKYQQHSLKVCGVAVAMVSPRAIEGWVADVNRQRPLDAKLPSAYAPTAEFGRKMAQRWAIANLGRLRREVSARTVARLAPLR